MNFDRFPKTNLKMFFVLVFVFACLCNVVCAFVCMLSMCLCVSEFVLHLSF